MPDHGLTPQHLDIIRQVLAPFAAYIDNVGLFGSRATGKYRPNSDIDIVLYGNMDEATINRIWTSFNDSQLPFKVDVVAYHLVTYPPFIKHIDEVMQPLFKNMPSPLKGEDRKPYLPLAD